MFVFSIGVVGAGVMGAQIAQAIAAAGEAPVVVCDRDAAAVERALAEAADVTRRQAERAVESGRLTAEQAAERVERTAAEVLAHRADARVIRGHQPQPPPDLADFERPLAAAIFPRVPGAEPVRVDREVDDGDATAGGGVIVSVPGHTPGSIALLLPRLGVLFTGDTIASHEGEPILGVFNIDRVAAIESVRKQAGLDFEVACFGHGPPLVGGAGRRSRALAEGL